MVGRFLVSRASNQSEREGRSYVSVPAKGWSRTRSIDRPTELPSSDDDDVPRLIVHHHLTTVCGRDSRRSEELDRPEKWLVSKASSLIDEGMER
jgi:hypothetical protein